MQLNVHELNREWVWGRSKSELNLLKELLESRGVVRSSNVVMKVKVVPYPNDEGHRKFKSKSLRKFMWHQDFIRKLFGQYGEIVEVEAN